MHCPLSCRFLIEIAQAGSLYFVQIEKEPEQTRHNWLVVVNDYLALQMISITTTDNDTQVIIL